MRCIFCKDESCNSKSIEHIIPEALGNVEHILPPGLVCDRCNNYFSRKIEKPLLESHYFLYARFENMIHNKRGRMPIVKAIIPPLKHPVEIESTNDDLTIIINPEDVPDFLEKFKSKPGKLLIPNPTKPEGINQVLSRFIGKVAIEAFAHRILNNMITLEPNAVYHEDLDPLRTYVRRGGDKVWAFHQRSIYPADAMFYSKEEDVQYNIPHEFTFLFTDKNELFFVLAVFGIEYTINMGGLEIDSYLEWLRQNDYKSPLYMDGVDYKFTRDNLPD